MNHLKRFMRGLNVPAPFSKPLLRERIAPSRLSAPGLAIGTRNGGLHGNAFITERNALALSEEYIRTIPAYPNNFKGKGIVICGGGIRLFTSAWVCINMLRKLGCQLPIQLWYLGEREMDGHMQKLVEPLNVTCVDALKLRQTVPARILNGWELKPYAILNSPFKEVLSLDADNVPVVNPEFLFDAEQYQSTGTIFWPDLGRLAPGRMIWSLCGVPYRDEAEFESGQIIVNKEKCWKALKLAMWYNEHSDFYYRHIHGDKETFHLAFRKFEMPYSMVPHPVSLKYGTLYQHDFKGNILFQHRNGPKWNYHSDNPKLPGFKYEQECMDFIRKLKEHWDGTIGRTFTHGSEKIKRSAASLITRTYNYNRVGYGSRQMSFLANGKINIGKAGCEQFWNLHEDKDKIQLEISSETARTCLLTLDSDGVWRGSWLIFEKMPVELSPDAVTS